MHNLKELSAAKKFSGKTVLQSSIMYNKSSTALKEEQFQSKINKTEKQTQKSLYFHFFYIPRKYIKEDAYVVFRYCSDIHILDIMEGTLTSILDKMSVTQQNK